MHYCIEKARCWPCFLPIDLESTKVKMGGAIGISSQGPNLLLFLMVEFDEFYQMDPTYIRLF